MHLKSNQSSHTTRHRYTQCKERMKPWTYTFILLQPGQDTRSEIFSLPCRCRLALLLSAVLRLGASLLAILLLDIIAIQAHNNRSRSSYPSHTWPIKKSIHINHCILNQILSSFPFFSFSLISLSAHLIVVYITVEASYGKKNKYYY